jgi:hypothetical protein
MVSPESAKIPSLQPSSLFARLLGLRPQNFLADGFFGGIGGRISQSEMRRLTF